MTKQDELYQIADELRAVASQGLYFSEIGYDRERYEKILKASARLVAAMEDDSFEEVYQQYTGNLAHFSPLPCVEAAVFREGKILLIQRRDNGLWALPGGLNDVGESWSDAAVRELWEEAGVRGRAVKLLGLFDSRKWQSRSRLHLYTAIFLIETDDVPGAANGDAGKSSFAETLDVGFYAEEALPPLSPGHDVRVPVVFRLSRGEMPAPYFD